MAQLILGKEVNKKITAELEKRSNELKRRGITPCLAVLRVGEDPSDLAYERTATKRAESLGIETKRFLLPDNSLQEDLEATVLAINEDPDIHGCLLFRPLPAFFDEKAICNALDPRKDIDGISQLSLGSIFTGEGEGYAPCTAAACVATLEAYDVPLDGKNVVIIGRSLVVGRPLSIMLLRRDATVTICHSHTRNLAEISRSADVVVCATGRPRGFGAEYFSAGQTVLDVGINFDDEGNVCGDVNFDEVEPLVDAITPVPRGIGSVTTTMLMAHLLSAAERLSEEV